MSVKRPILTSVLVALGALAYGASPIDLVPELLAGPLGFGDDAVVLIGAGIAIWRILRNRARGPAPRPDAGPTPDVDPAPGG